MIQPVVLEYGETGSGPPLYALHGLYGSSRNLGVLARGLGERFRVRSFDLRNHGISPWAATITYDAMAADVALAVRSDPESSVRLLGHSMGGKVAMVLALRRPELVESLVILDVAPVRYLHDQRTTIRAMLGLNLEVVASRAEADRQLSRALPDRETRGFLLQNLIRDEDGRFRWRINLPQIEQCLDEILGFPEAMRGHSYPGPVLLVSGERSPYVDEDGVRMLRMLFPAAEHVCIQGAGHLPHVEQPARVLGALREFLSRDRVPTCASVD